jgi:hypothetical protein
MTATPAITIPHHPPPSADPARPLASAAPRRATAVAHQDCSPPRQPESLKSEPTEWSMDGS